MLRYNICLLTIFIIKLANTWIKNDFFVYLKKKMYYLLVYCTVLSNQFFIKTLPRLILTNLKMIAIIVCNHHYVN